MTNTFQITATTEIECCGRRELRPGHAHRVGSLHCPHCGDEAWMAHGHLVTTAPESGFFFRSRARAEAFVASQQAKRA